MLNKPNIEYIQFLYENIFEESVNNSKEFTTFVQNENPHPLRIKVEETAEEINRKLIHQFDNNNEGVVTQLSIYKLTLVIELDTFLTNYIENNYV
jgi:hypothetical protein